MGLISKIKFSKIYVSVKSFLNTIFSDSEKTIVELSEEIDQNFIDPSSEKLTIDNPELETFAGMTSNPPEDLDRDSIGKWKDEINLRYSTEAYETFKSHIFQRNLAEEESYVFYYQSFKSRLIQKYSEFYQIPNNLASLSGLGTEIKNGIPRNRLNQILSENSVLDSAKQRVKKEQIEVFFAKEFKRDRDFIYKFISKGDFEKARKIHKQLSIKIVQANSKLKNQFKSILPRIVEAETEFFKKEQERKLKEELERKRLEDERLKALQLAAEETRKTDEERLLQEKKKEFLKKSEQENTKRWQELEFEKRRIEAEFKIAKQLEEEAKRKKEEEVRKIRLKKQERVNPNISISIREKVNEDARRTKENLLDSESKILTNSGHLNSLLKKKENWKEYELLLDQNGIKNLYHFTDARNISSIKKNGGLYSWYYCDINRISIPFPGGSFDSRKNDSINRRNDFVRLAFNTSHPMLYIAKNDGRIDEYFWLRINREVAYFQFTEFSDKNAAAFRSYTPNIGCDLRYLENIRFDILKKGEIIKHFNLSNEEKSFNQAEVLIKTWVPLKYIENINDL